MSKKIEVKAGKVWARYNGVSIAVSAATEEHVKVHRPYDVPFQNDWRRPGDEVYPDCEYIACAETGEIIVPTKRIPIKPSERVVDTLLTYEVEIEKLREISARIYGTCDCDSPMWAAIEYLMHEQTAFAMRNHVAPGQFCRLVG